MSSFRNTFIEFCRKVRKLLVDQRELFETLAHVFTVFGIIFAFFSLRIAAKQLKLGVIGLQDTAKQAEAALGQLKEQKLISETQRQVTSAELIIDFSKRLDEPDYRRIIAAISDSCNYGKPLFKYDGGSITEDDLDRLLGQYELISVASRHSLLDPDMIYEAFSEEVEMVYSTVEVWRYIKNARLETGEKDAFSGFEGLGKGFEGAKPINCVNLFDTSSRSAEGL